MSKVTSFIRKFKKIIPFLANSYLNFTPCNVVINNFKKKLVKTFMK